MIQGLSLFREIGDDCFRCAIKRKKFIEASMGPIADDQHFILSCLISLGLAKSLFLGML